MRITAQAMDTVYGRPAAGVRATLERGANGCWMPLATAETDDGGQIGDWAGLELERGVYRIVFDSDHYFVGLGVVAAYPEIAVMFRIQGESGECRVQVMLAPHSYSAYFGTAG